jgi:DNA-binding NtrC family response regulator
MLMDNGRPRMFPEISLMPAGKPSILVIDDDSEIRYSLSRVLSARDYAVASAGSGEEALAVVKKEAPDVIFLDIRMGGMGGIETLQHIRSINPRQLVILMTAFGTAQTAIEAMKYGAYDYIMKPFNPQKVLNLAENALKTHADLRAGGEYKPSLNTEDYKEGIVGSSAPMQEVFKTIGQITASDVTVMITGESGTGKELVARSIFKHSHRANRPFIAVNCAAIPENLIESDLFGHEKGSYTGATAQRIGKFELCDGGTIFLDEIGDMALATQTKILRVLQEGEIQRVGGTETIKVDVRVIAATNKDLEEMVRVRTFREDLYYRLNVVRIRMPTLRERRDDIPQIVDYMLQTLEKQKKTRVKRVAGEAMAVLMRHPWPGNVRELENVIYRSAVIAQGDTILLKDLPPEIREAAGAAPAAAVLPPAAAPLPETATAPEPPAPDVPPESAPEPAPVRPEPAAAPAEPKPAPAPELSLEDALDFIYARLKAEDREPVLERLEREMITRVLRDERGNLVRASERLGMTRTTLRKRIDTLGLKI